MSIPDAVLQWLLEPKDPSVQYRTLTELLDRPPTDPAVQAARAAIPTSKKVARIFDKMHPDGYWLHRGKGAGVDYAMSSSTHFVLAFLAELGMDRDDDRIARAVERYLSLSEPDVPDNPAPYQIPPDYRNHQSCLYAYNLRTFAMLGYAADPRIATRKAVLVEDVRFDGGYLCDRDSFGPHTKSCIRGSIKALLAFAHYPDLWETERCQQLVDYFLRRRLLYRNNQPGQLVRGEMAELRFPFVISGSLLEPLVALSIMGYGQHEALAPAWELLHNRFDAEGKLVVDWYPPTVFTPGPKGKPNKWTTFYGYLALRRRH